MSFAIDYPNPVLSFERDDYIESCKFDVAFQESEIEVTDEYIQIHAKCELISNCLNNYIIQGKACIVVLIYSSGTLYRKAFVFDKDKRDIIIQIPKFSVKGTVDFCGYILAKDNIDKFCCDGEFNDLYFKSTVFSVKKGDILAKGQERGIPVDDSELEKPLTSIFRIDENVNDASDIECDFTDEKIIVRLSKRLNNLYWEMKTFNNGALVKYLIGLIIYPALVEAISKMCESYKADIEDYNDKRWFRAIEHKLKNLGIDLSEQDCMCSYVDLADKLLGEISFSGLKNVKETIDQEVNNGESSIIGGVD